jgi:transcription elongation GreA/GreB family factor
MIDKSELRKHCIDLLSKKASELEQEILQVNEAARSETKSSSGDKHETARAMMHIEREKLQKQLLTILNQKEIFKSIDPTSSSDVITLGSVFSTKQGTFYIATAIGKTPLKDQNIFVISMDSPFAQAFKGAKQGDSVNFRGKKHKIEALF